ncbi:MAG TPA: glycosyltransferase family 4 protein, partial [Anaerolineaceae bacterium]|nr:glycosyltransferase family 4 protein [Anaerolineaceae bacterium]
MNPAPNGPGPTAAGQPAVGVCLGSMAFYPLYAGPALRFQRYGPGLQRRGARLRVFTQAVTPALIARDGSVAVNGSGNGELPPAVETVDGMLVQRVALPGGWRREPEYFRRLAEYCRRHRAEIDVVQLLNADFLAAPWLLAMRRLGIRLVFTHTLLSELAAGGLKRRLQTWHRRLPLELVDTVVVSSQAMRDRLLELGSRTPVQVIPNGVDLTRFQPVASPPARAAVRRRLGLDPDWTVVLAVGPVIPRKGADALVAAFVQLAAEFPAARLVLVGPRHDLARPELQDFHDRLEAAIATAGAQERVIFTGPVSAVDAYLQAADVLAFPSRREGMPNVVPEAMASGLPVVMTPFTGLPAEFGQPGRHYLLSDWQPETLAADLRRLLADA